MTPEAERWLHPAVEVRPPPVDGHGHSMFPMRWKRLIFKSCLRRVRGSQCGRRTRHQRAQHPVAESTGGRFVNYGGPWR